MDADTVALVTWRMRRLVRSLNWTAALALALAAFDVAFYFSAVAPTMLAGQGLRAHASDLRATAAREPDHAARRHDPQAELDAFYAALAQPAHVPDLLRRLHRVAANQGLVVEQGEYRPLPDPSGKLTRYQILLPARGTYPEVRRFIAQASRELPALALDGIAFQRQQIGDEIVETQIKFTLFVQVQG